MLFFVCQKIDWQEKGDPYTSYIEIFIFCGSTMSKEEFHKQQKESTKEKLKFYENYIRRMWYFRLIKYKRKVLDKNFKYSK